MITKGSKVRPAEHTKDVWFMPDDVFMWPGEVVHTAKAPRGTVAQFLLFNRVTDRYELRQWYVNNLIAE